LGAEQITPPIEFQINARRFLYYQLFGSSLPFEFYLKEDGVWAGYTILKSFSITELLPENSETAKALVQGIIDDAPFEIPL